MLRVILLLLCLPTATDSLIYQAKFIVSPIGSGFNSTNPSDPLHIQNGTASIFKCIEKCTNDIGCRTVSFDSTTHQCSLFAAWNFEGNLSSSPTSQVAFVPQEPALYTTFLQPCTPSIHSLNRYLRCVNNTWICPYRYFFNGNVCEPWRSFNQPCLLDEWCDATKSLLCSNAFHGCRCSSSMSWNGSICVFGKYLLSLTIEHRMRFDLVTVCLVCPSGQSGLSFDDLRGMSVVPSGYGGFQWSNVQVGNDTWMPQYGWQLLYNVNPSAVSISRLNGTFRLYSMDIPDVWTSTLNVTVTGLHMGMVVNTRWYQLNDTFIWTIFCNMSNIDEISISYSPLLSTALSIDNLCFSV